MFKNRFLPKLKKYLDLQIITQEQYEKICECEKKASSRALILDKILKFLIIYFFSSLLIVFFVSNWQGLTRTTKVLFLLGTLGGGFGGILYFLKSNLFYARLFGVFVNFAFGLNLLLIGQMYHLGDDLPLALCTIAYASLLLAFSLRGRMLFLQSITMLYIAFFWALSNQSNLIYTFLLAIFYGFYYVYKYQSNSLKILNCFNVFIFVAYFDQSYLIYTFLLVIFYGFYYVYKYQSNSLKILNCFNVFIFVACTVKDFMFIALFYVFALGMLLAKKPAFLSSPIIQKISYITLSLLIFSLSNYRHYSLEFLKQYTILAYLLLFLPSLFLWFIKQKADALLFGSIVLGIILDSFTLIPANLMGFYYWVVFFGLCMILILQHNTMEGIILLILFSLLQYISIVSDYFSLGLFFGICCIVLFIILRKKNGIIQK
ncbi:DUF2157 domain-containing protein [Helicobacter anseris]|nr:DUF2157 domain-containing protein [Helicobacter anseris]